MKRILSLSVLAALAASVLFLACPSQKTEWKIGVIAPLTGDAGIYGQPLQKGLELAAEQVNASGGVKDRPLRLLFEDTQADPKVAVTVVNKLIQVDKVDAIIGDMFSSTTLAAAPVAQEKGIVMLSPTASAEAVPKVGDHVFSIYPSDSYDGQFLGAFVAATLKPSKVAIVGVQADAMIGVKAAFAGEIKRAGGTIALDETYVPKTTDFRTVLAKVKSSGAAVVFVPGYLEELVTLLKQAKELGIKATFVSISTAYDPKLFELAKQAAEGLIISAPVYDPQSADPVIGRFRQAFKAKFGSDPDVWAAYGYDALYILIQAMGKAATSKQPLHTELAAVKDFPGVTGKTSFTADRAVSKELRVLVVTKGAFQPYR